MSLVVSVYCVVFFFAAVLFLPGLIVIMARDVSVPDTYAESHIGNTATEAGAAAIDQTAANKIPSTMNWPTRTSSIQLP